MLWKARGQSSWSGYGGSASKNKARAKLRGPTAVRTVCEPSGINPVAQTKEWVWREGSSV